MSQQQFTLSRGPQNKDDYRAYVCGSASAVLNIATTFPLNKVMFRQMLHGVNSQSAVQQLRREGIGFLYRGVGPPLILKMVSTAIMFGSYEDVQPWVAKFFTSRYVIISVSGGMAGFSEALLVTPFERIQTLLQDRKYHTVYKNSLHAFKDVNQQYGWKEFYRGFSPIAMRNMLGNVFYFMVKDDIFKVLPTPKSQLQFYFSLFLSGAVTGAVSSTIFYPLNVVKTSMQSQCGGARVSLKQAFLNVYNERGRSLRKMYLGVHINYTRSFLSWGVVNTSYEGLMKMLSDKDGLNS